jgi:transcriptional adapter 2-alpha
METLNFPLFDEEWGADEELLLLEGIEMYGLGNWGDVSDHVGTKTGGQSREHYFATYINVPTAPFPDLEKILTTAESLQQRRKAIKNGEPVPKLAPIVKPKPPPTETTTTTKVNHATNVHGSKQHCWHDLGGYMNLRGDFDQDWENEAEGILCDITFYDEDTPQEKELKLQVIEIYNQKLDERIRRKKFIVERNLFDYKKMEKRKTREEKDLYDRLRPFMRIMEDKEHEEFLQSLISEQQIRDRIEELKQYRQIGITTLQEALQYRSHLSQRVQN